uniref:Uncharacterized protein n=1 Tax=Guillardia theta TaxID=55529 RepID=A0A7S4P367_GUITH|mmetsp:Transcript_42201/g.132939  ORF Transcript_42201/g.132939 Transcript_42201/m.132939 type:complete len:852 (+) Transcript_42201:229-2784(+)
MGNDETPCSNHLRIVYWGSGCTFELRDTLHDLEPAAYRYIKLFQAELMASWDCLACRDCSKNARDAWVGKESGWARELAKSLVFVPIFQHLGGRQTLEELARVRPEEDQDRQDKFLAELLVALYLIYRDDRKLSQIRAVVPVVVSEGSRWLLSRQAMEGLSLGASLKTCKSAARELSLIGAGEYPEIFERLQRWSIKDTVRAILYGGDGIGGMTIFYTSCCVFEEPCLVEHKSRDEDAFACACMVKDRLPVTFGKYVKRVVERYLKHTCCGGAVSDILEKHGFKGSILESLSAFSHQQCPSEATPSRCRRCNARAGCCLLRAATAMEAMCLDESITQKLGEAHVTLSHDKRLRPLKEQLYRYKDIEADGILAMMTTNCIETGILKLPTQLAMLGLSSLYASFAYFQLAHLFSDARWVYQPDERKPYIPKTLRITRVLDPAINVMWAVGVPLSMYLALRESPLLAKRLISLIVFLGAMLYLTSGISDYVQCKYAGGGIGSACNGRFSLTASFSVLCVFLSGHLVQRYIWVIVYLAQGGYIFYTMSLNSSWSVWAKTFFRVYGGIIITLVPLILIRYQKMLKQAHGGMALETTKIEEVWRSALKAEREMIDDLASKSRRVSARLQMIFKAAKKFRPSWHRHKVQRQRFSSKGKILQSSQDIESMYEKAQLISPFFQMFIKSWNVVGFVHEGRLKKISRAMQKVVRSYGRDPSYLTDLVRSTVIVKSMSELNSWLQRLLDCSTIGRNGVVDEKEEEEEGDTKKLFNITSIKNRFDPKYDARESAGYRDLCVNVEMGWKLKDFPRGLEVVPVCRWKETPGLIKHICEIQVTTEDIFEVKKYFHKQYITFRNIVCQ